MMGHIRSEGKRDPRLGSEIAMGMAAGRATGAPSGPEGGWRHVPAGLLRGKAIYRFAVPSWPQAAVQQCFPGPKTGLVMLVLPQKQVS
jgi:hypothetical protein